MNTLLENTKNTLSQPSNRTHGSDLTQTKRQELLMGLEPMTSSLPRTRSTTELQQQRYPQNERAGEGNRTLTTSLEGWSSAIELHPLLLFASFQL